ncbi:Ivy family c-type lysozyme inhibitor [Candidatus Methylocalor cossyra]|uniref:Uncharacterized protein n=1 Tax=Candidatus Methylocalor cossyra TaxID=3108543 RepID=A0ABM9NJY6_9GAMM
MRTHHLAAVALAALGAALPRLALAMDEASLERFKPEEMGGDWVPAGSRCDSPLRIRIDAKTTTLINGRDTQTFRNGELFNLSGNFLLSNSFNLVPDVAQNLPWSITFNVDEKPGLTQIEYLHNSDLQRRFPLHKKDLLRCTGTTGLPTPAGPPNRPTFPSINTLPDGPPTPPERCPDGGTLELIGTEPWGGLPWYFHEHVPEVKAIATRVAGREEPWVLNFDGPSGFNRLYRKANTEIVVFDACRPHDCQNSFLWGAYDRTHRRYALILSEAGRERRIGEHTEEIDAAIACARKDEERYHVTH